MQFGKLHTPLIFSYGDLGYSNRGIYDIYLLYNCGELQTQLDHIVACYGVVCHCGKWRPEKEVAPEMNH